MPRQPRLVEPFIPLHIVQRGVNRWPTFLEETDFALYRHALDRASADARCEVHAYVLMTNHVHLLVTPSHPDAAAKMMRALGSRYVRFFNDRYRRRGTLWEGRFRSIAIKSDAHFLACSRYIELNPVRARMVSGPHEYAWSSFARNAAGRPDDIVRPHPLYLALGPNAEERRRTYRALFERDIPPDVVAAIRASTRSELQPPAHTYEEAVTALNEKLFGTVAGTATDGERGIPWPDFPVFGFAEAR